MTIGAALGGAIYLANCSYEGIEANITDLAITTTIGGVSRAIGSSGANGKNLRGVYKHLNEVLRSTKSAKKVAMYTAKKKAAKTSVKKATKKTFRAGMFSNVANYIRKLFK